MKKKRLRASKGSRSNLTGDISVKQVMCDKARKLPWDCVVEPVDLSDRYQCYWEARYPGRMTPGVEICDSFEEYAKTWARMLEYGWIARRTIANDNVLDIGSGKSTFPAVLSLLTRKVMATDIEDYHDVHLRLMDSWGARYEWIRSDARQLSFCNDSMFDCVTCVSVLEHIPASGDITAFQEMVRVCKPGGRVLISVPYSHAQLIEDYEHPSGLQRYYTFHDIMQRFMIKGTLLRDFNFVVCGMPEDEIVPRFGHPEESGIILACLEKKRDFKE